MVRKLFTLMKKYISLTLLLLAALTAWDVRAQETVDERYLDAVHLYLDGDLSAASGLFTKVIADDPSNDAAWYYRGLCQMSLKEMADGVESLSMAVTMDSTNYWYRDALSMAYMSTGQVDKAREGYEDLIARFPRRMDAYYTLTNIYLGTGDLDKAVRTICSIEELNGKTDGTVLTRYRILLQQKKPEEALQALEEYCDEYPSPQVLSLLGDHEAGLSEDSLAIAYYDRALELDRSYPPALLGKAEVHRLSKDYDSYFSTLHAIMTDTRVDPQAKTDYLSQILRHMDPRFLQNHKARLDSCHRDMLTAHPADSAVTRTAAIYFFSTSDTGTAETLFRQNVKDWPGAIEPAMDLLEFYSLNRDYAKILECCDSLKDTFRDRPLYLDNYAIVAEFNLREYDKVVQRAKSLVARAPADSAVCLASYSVMGDSYMMMGDKANAYRSYDKALKINPDEPQVLNNYAYYLALDGRKLGKALKMISRAVELEPDNTSYLDTIGWILHLKGRDKEAKPYFKHAMLYGGKESRTCMEHYAEVLEALGEDDLAKVYRKQASALEADN